MNDQVTRTLNVFLHLNSGEQQAFLAEVRRLQEEGPQQRNRVVESVNRVMQVSLGPIAGGCPYCGQ